MVHVYACIVHWRLALLCHKNQKEGVLHNRMFKLVSLDLCFQNVHGHGSILGLDICGTQKWAGKWCNKSKANEICLHTEELLHVMLNHMYDTSYFLPLCLNNGKLNSQEHSSSLPLCLNNGKLNSQEHSSSLFPTTTLFKHLCWNSLTGWYSTHSWLGNKLHLIKWPQCLWMQEGKPLLLKLCNRTPGFRSTAWEILYWIWHLTRD